MSNSLLLWEKGPPINRPNTPAPEERVSLEDGSLNIIQNLTSEGGFPLLQKSQKLAAMGKICTGFTFEALTSITAFDMSVSMAFINLGIFLLTKSHIGIFHSGWMWGERTSSRSTLKM
ncbi:wsv429 [White spot syndrome virus]|uniref:Wsv429 n=4 Tax=White spot syndrome virus TaxID=342409 RepID=Q8VAI4_WSSVS|nr:wsv429 [Shrimp white spot syndrome virus]AFX59806.1 wsv429 [White spot syndrome virus]AAL33431.1 wsv429 [Shrimp white spot syndrome virus]AAL89356.1 WSSV488 [Shrimp white spot syndrome virus]AWQ60553.1 wsv429 [Shrimp white spot syndrome virus]AWQ60995.1 wsv429 [Shrimp white spot syndrome virus]